MHGVAAVVQLDGDAAHRLVLLALGQMVPDRVQDSGDTRVAPQLHGHEEPAFSVLRQLWLELTKRAKQTRRRAERCGLYRQILHLYASLPRLIA